MFKCDYCEVPQAERIKPNRVIVDTRAKTYNHRDGRQTFGTEIVHEADLCDTCESKFDNG